jgi:hypothetical protein
VDEYLKYRKISVASRRKIQNYYGLFWRMSGASFEEEMILHDLPSNLRMNAMQQISAEAVKRIPMLKGLGSSCSAQVYVNCYPHYFEEGLIYAAKEQGNEMYFVVSGTVKLQGIKLHESHNQPYDPARLPPKPFPESQVFLPSSFECCFIPSARLVQCL